MFRLVILGDPNLVPSTSPRVPLRAIQGGGAGGRDARELLCAALHAAARLVRTQQATIYLAGEDDGSLLIISSPQDELGNRLQTELEVIRLPRIGPGVAGAVLLSGHSATVPHASQDKRFDPEVDRAPGYVVDNLLCAPVSSALGKPIAAVQLANKVSERWQPGKHDAHVEPRAFDPSDERTLALFCAMLGPVLERQQLSMERFYTR